MVRPQTPTGRSVPLPILIGLSVGIGMSTQSFFTGRLATGTGEPAIAAAVTSSVCLIGFLLLNGLTGRFRRGSLKLAPGPKFRWWYLIAPATGLTWLVVAANAAPRIGVAVLTVALVCGQTIGALVLDRIGLSTAGRHDMTPARVLGVLIAILAVTVSALGAKGELMFGWLALAVAVGAFTGVQQATISQIARTTGDGLVTGLVMCAATTTLMVPYALIATGASLPDHVSVDPIYWFGGGVIGVALFVLVSTIVGRLGVLRLMLLLVAGQSIGALVLDLIAPPEGESVTLATLGGLLLIFVAVAVSGRDHVSRRPRVPEAPAPVSPAPPLPVPALSASAN
jgi:transporter family-2 protein